MRKREDGYHEVRMIMQTVHLHDRIVMEKTKEPGIRTETNLPYVPDGEGNLAWRAAKLLMDEFGLSEGVDIKIRKCIPVAAGMAGGSTDAAAVLVGMNRLFGLGLGKKELMRRGVKLGADIPYCILRGTALSEGIGEILTELPPAPQCHVVLAKPQISVSTKAVYEKLRVDALGPEAHPDIDGMAAAIRAGSLDGVTARLGNVLETVTIPDHPEIGAIKRIMLEHGAEGALMSGSGPTVFGIFKDREEADAVCVTIPDHPEIGAIKRIMLEHGAEGALMSGSGPTVFGIFKDREEADAVCGILRETDNGRLTRQVYLTRFFNKKPAR